MIPRSIGTRSASWCARARCTRSRGVIGCTPALCRPSAGSASRRCHSIARAAPRTVRSAAAAANRRAGPGTATTTLAHLRHASPRSRHRRPFARRARSLPDADQLHAGVRRSAACRPRSAGPGRSSRPDVHNPHGGGNTYELERALDEDMLLTSVGWANSYYQAADDYADEWGVGWRAQPYETPFGRGDYTEMVGHPLADDAAHRRLSPPDPAPAGTVRGGRDASSRSSATSTGSSASPSPRSSRRPGRCAASSSC